MKTKLSLLTLAVSAIVSTTAVAEVRTYELTGGHAPEWSFPETQRTQPWYDLSLTYDREALNGTLVPGGSFYHLDLTTESFSVNVKVYHPNGMTVELTNEAPAGVTPPGTPPMMFPMDGNLNQWFWSEHFPGIPMYIVGDNSGAMFMMQLHINNDATEPMDPNTAPSIPSNGFDTSFLRLVDLETLHLSPMLEPGIDNVMIGINPTPPGFQTFGYEIWGEMFEVTVDGSSCSSDVLLQKVEANGVKLDRILCILDPATCNQ